MENFIFHNYYEWAEDVQPFQGSDLTNNVPYDETGDWEEILSSGKSINGFTCDMSPEVRIRLQEQGILSLLIVPVFIKGEFWGFIGVDDCHKERVFTDVGDRMLRSTALLFVHAYQQNEANRIIREQTELQQTIYSVAPVGVNINDEHMNMIDCNPTFAKMMGAPKEKILENFFDFTPEYQPDGMKSTVRARELFNRAISGETPRIVWDYLLPNGEHLPCEVTMKCVNLDGKPTVLAFAYDLSETKRLKSELDSLQDKVYECPLTGIYNRRFFDEESESYRIISHHMKSRSQLSLLMLDVDRFKNYNDGYGHQAGDECLKAIAQILSKSIPSGGFVARYGGEEFVIVLPTTDAEKACKVAERIIKNMHKADIPHMHSDVADHVTLSIGVASGTMKPSLTINDFVKVADNMMRSSEQAGRNRYTFGEMEKEQKKLN
jgi:diguanylate cyclase (GGDEF)-like protein/PAS domain S-box-containing protein